jgi:hypothetical protein
MVRAMLAKTLVVVALCASISFGQHVGLSARTDSTNYRIGDWIYLHVDGTVGAEVDTIAPAFRDSIGGFEVLSATREGAKPSWTVRLMTIDSGNVFVPPIPFDYRVRGDTTVHRAFTNSIYLNVRGVTVDPKGGIKDIKGPISAPWQFADFIPYIIVLLILAGAAFGYYYYRKKQKQKLEAYVPPKPKIAPHTAALFALRELEDRKLWQNGKVKQYYSEVTEVIRTFFEGRWNFIALELTSDEILAHMKKIPEAESVSKEMQSFFVTADLVKFAKYVPAPEENETELRWAYDIVRAMTPSPTTVEEEQAEETANVG